MIIRLVLLLAVILCVLSGHGQDSISRANFLPYFRDYSGKKIAGTIDSLWSQPALRIEKTNPQVFKRGDTLWIYSGICKPLKTITHVITPGDLEERVTAREKSTLPIKVHGNVQYDFLYRSYIDTPFSQHDFQQHTVQTSLNIVVKDRYPLKLNLSTRFSNSPFFRNFTNVNLQFDKYAVIKEKKQQLVDKVAASQFQRPDLKMMEAVLQEEIEKVNSLKQRLSSPDIFQAIIEEREKRYYNDLRRNTGIPAYQKPDALELEGLTQRVSYKLRRQDSGIDSASSDKGSKYSDFIERKKKELDSLQENVIRLQKKADSLRNFINKDVATIRQKVYKTSSKRELQRIARENGIADEKEEKVERFLSDVKSIGIGRSMINYSELTAWNVSLTGFNMEYNPGFYAAFAAGKVDYGFRDFLGRNTRRNGQSLLMGRIGIGDRDQKAIIFSAFAGKKYNYGSIVADSVSSHVKVAGYSVEAILKRNENTSLSAEVAKTTKPVSGSFQNNNALHGLMNFSDNSNLGLSIKGQTILQETDTRLSGFFRKTGENFQSFSLFTYNSDQTAWSAKIDQSFLKNKIGLIAMLRRNDFTNPFTEKTFKTSTIFKSLQLNIRIPKWPMLSVGYYPGTQLYVIDKERIRENAYYILNASAVHNYSLANIRMLSSLIYNSYTNKGTDSGFVAYKGVSYMASHSLIFSKLQLQGLVIFTDQEQMQFHTLESNGDYSINRKMRIGAGIKYNKVKDGVAYWGNRAQATIEIGKIGGLQLQYEKSYLPTIYKTLFPVETGRVSWFKYF